MHLLAAPQLLNPSYLVDAFGLVGILSIIFAECGLLVGFFLPGDTLLFSAGLLVSEGSFHVPLWVLCASVSVAAIAGNLAGYAIGYKAGPMVFRRPDSALFKHEHVDRAHAFFDRWGAATIVLARFVPIVRTFVTTMAGAGKMRFSVFAGYSVIGGTLWGTSIPLAGYFLGKVQLVRDHVEVILLGAVVVVVFFAILPVAFEVWRRSRARRSRSAPVVEDLTVDAPTQH
ncbi:MAG: VTT domain-containing protein [Actinobacteria bacterium]|nr:VTT domain-containing protein [Actinomycetota bacterium]MBI3686469.1 VTT domain-containing protein [Actinomycetota bacterium]